MKILIIKSVFCPNKKYLDISINSLLKINTFPTVDLLLIGWTNTHTYTQEIINIIPSLTFQIVHTEFWPINYGKCKIFNYVIDFIKQNDTYTHIIFMDHDIWFDNITSTILESIINVTSSTQSLGLIAFNQKGDNRHRPTIYQNIETNNNIKIIWPNDDWSIASGAFIISTQTFKNINYFDLKSVYGLDDHYLCKQLTDKGYTNVVLANYYVMHPLDNNKEYKSWKNNNITKMLNKEDINYYMNIEESMNLFIK